MTHSHAFDETDWPFPVSAETLAYITRPIVHGDAPILTIAHDHDGDWQFLCRTTYETADLCVVCLGCIFERHPFVGAHADLSPGWVVWREDAHSPWQREPFDADDSG